MIYYFTSVTVYNIIDYFYALENVDVSELSLEAII